MRTLIFLPLEGVRLLPLEGDHDGRGCLTEIFRQHWDLAPRPVQWDAVQSAANVLRGVHVCPRHTEYLLLLCGQALLGLSDLRPGSASYGASCLVPLESDSPMSLEIPPGVAHGLYFAAPALHLRGASQYRRRGDEMGCRWDDPALGIPWPALRPALAARDDELGTLAELLEELRSAPAAAA